MFQTKKESALRWSMLRQTPPVACSRSSGQRNSTRSEAKPAGGLPKLIQRLTGGRHSNAQDPQAAKRPSEPSWALALTLGLMVNSPENYLPQGAIEKGLWWSLWPGSKGARETTKCRPVWLVGQGGQAVPTSSPRIAVREGRSKNDPETCSSCSAFSPWLPAVAKTGSKI